MTDSAIGKETVAPFWTRVRTALGAWRPVGQERVPAYGQAAIARSIGIMPKLGVRIDEELALGWHRAADRKVLLSLLVIEMDWAADYFTAYGKAGTDECVRDIMMAIGQVLPREADCCLRLGRSTLVIVLPDLPALMARATAGKIAEAVRGLALPHKESHAGTVTLGMGLAVTNPRGSYDRKFFETAAEALKKAQRRGLGRLEAVDLRPAQERKHKAA